MKKINFLMILIAVITVIMNSCKSEEEILHNDLVMEDVTLLVYGGLAEYLIHGAPSWGKDPTGAQAGIIFPIAVAKNWSFRPEVSLSMEGSNYNDNGLRGKVNLLYANVPLMIRYETPKGIFGEAGIQTGFLLRAKDKYSGITEDYKEHITKVDFAVPFGMGYEFKNKLGLGIRVVPGISNIETSGNDKSYNFLIALRATYKLKLKKPSK